MKGAAVCPVCALVIDTSLYRGDPSVYINKHIDRCTGVTSRNARNNTSYEEQEEVYDYGERSSRSSSRHEVSVQSKPKVGRTLEDGEVLNDSDEEIWTFDGDTRPKRPATVETTNTNRKKRLKKKGIATPDDSIAVDADIGEIAIVNDDLNENLNYYVGNIRANAVLDDWEEHLYVNRLLDQGFDGTNDDDSLVETDYAAWAHRSTWETLHQYQKEGCKWLYNLYNDNVGGILGDEMGLGKTAQICTHFGSLGRLKRKRHKSTGIFLIVCPATLLQHWLNEMHKWEPTMRTVILHGISKTGGELMQFGERGVDFILRKLQREESTRALTLLVTYEGVKRNKEALLLIEWTGVALDEGQKIRNLNAEVSKVCKLLPTFHRIVISGTPIQNNLQELWNLFDFIYPGRIGSLQAFEIEFAIPIRTGGYANASRLQVEIANQTALMLQRIIQPYLLRRKKDDLSVAISLPQKTEQVLFCKLSRLQRGHYVDILNSPEVQAILNNRMTSFRAITTLRKLCNHPILLVQKNKNFLRGNLNVTEAAADADDDDNDDKYVRSLDYISWEDSGKMIVLKKILSTWHGDGDSKVVLFSQTQSMLSLVERMVNQLHFTYLRLDGSTAVSRRSAIIDRFNGDRNIFIILLTTRTGGLGISLTAANKVILLDPDWNPQTDIQARERAWRLGQKRDVTIYRLITRGTIEEKIYQRQIFKLLLSNRILDKPKQYLTRGIFSKSDIRDLFRLTDRDYNDDGKADVHLPQAGMINLALDNDGDESRNTPEVGLDEIDMLNASAYSEQVIANDSRLQNLSDDDDDEVGEDAPSKSNNTDKKILQALFSGESIAAVYNHNFFESEVSDSTRNIQRMAERSVQQACRQLTASMPSTTVIASTSSSSNNTGNRFGGTSNGNETASSSLLSSLRGLSSQSIAPAARTVQNRNNDVIIAHSDTAAEGRPSRAAARPTTSLLADLNAHVLGMPPPSATTSHANSRPSNASTTTGNTLSSASGASLEDNIKARLQSIFSSASSNGLTTDFILNKFADLPDRFAPIFKAQLKAVAKFTNGKWVKTW